MSNAELRIRIAVLGACLVVLLGGFRLAAKDAGSGYLKVKANPSSAGVFVDGKYLGPAANFGFTRRYALPAGEHEVILRDPRCQDFTTKTTIEAGRTSSISQSLQPATLSPPPYGLLRIEGGSSKFDAVFVNEKFMGHVDEFNNFAQGLLLNPGEYTLKVISPSGNQELEQKIKVEEKKTTIVHVGTTA